MPSPRLVAVFAVFSVLGSLSAETLRCTGILGNSGAQGATLVRFGEKTASGMGVVYDSTGSLWDRGGEGKLNRYALDGRLLASYSLPVSGSLHEKDTAVLFPEMLLVKLGKQLHTLPVNAPPGTAATLLPVDATRLSFNIHNGWAAAALDKKVFLVNARGEAKPVAELAENVEDIDIGLDGGVYIQSNGKMTRVDEAAPEGQRGPWPSPGDRAQWLAGHWFGTAWHGTLRRFKPDFMPSPGVVLGGASGSFIGYVPGNHELHGGRGLAHLGGNLFAVSGAEGVLHLLEWKATEQRFTILRRIGAVPRCSALTMDNKGRVWFHSGIWEWNDGPDTPLRHSVPPPDAPGFFGAVTMENGVMIAPAVRWNQKVLYQGTLDGPAGLSDQVDLPADPTACALVTRAKRPALLIVNATGSGSILYVAGNGKYEGKAGEAKLQTSPPLLALASLASLNPSAESGNTLFAAADGMVVELAAEGDIWRETKRWNTWGDTPDTKFGDKIFLAAAGGRLFVSDTARHRVLCFDAATRKLLATFGSADQSGSSLSTLTAPQSIAANGQRAIVFDSGNQRLVKLEIAP